MQAESRRPSWTAVALWLCLAAAVSALGWVSLGACGIAWTNGRPMLSYCPAPATAAEIDVRLLERERARAATLEASLHRLRLTLAAAPSCPAPEPPVQIAASPPPPAAPPAEEPPADVATADVDPEAPVPDRRPVAPARPPPPEPPPDIPEDAWQDRDLGLLEGCWQRITNLSTRDTVTGRTTPVRSWQVCFDTAGQGRQVVIYENGLRCEGGISAAFLPDGRLGMRDTGAITCPDRRIHAHVYECDRVADGTAVCVARQPESGTSDIRSTFQR